MHILLDHIGAFIVATVLFVSMFTMINRSRQNAVDMQIGQIVQEQAYDFARVLERDLENIRSEAQVIKRNQFIEPDIEESICGFASDEFGRTTSLIFPTLADARLGANSDIVNVRYELVPADTSLTYAGQELQLFTLNRYLRPGDSTIEIPDGSSGAFITHFAVTMHTEGVGGTELSGTASTGECPPDGTLSKTHIEIQAALPSAEYTTGDQRSTSNLNVTRYGAVVYSPNR
ncbi:MAG: hypothetical protein AAF564_26010 [Bacteroidota bacterium]